MKTTVEFLDAIKAKHGLTSDYQIAKLMGVTRAGISSYRIGRSHFDDETAILAAQMLGIDRAYVLACIHAERAKNAPVKSAWMELAEKLGGIAAALFLALTLSLPYGNEATAGAAFGVENPATVYYVK